jgi:hypothetical protein
LACQACHVPETHAPVLMDEDLALPTGAEHWRNLGGDPLAPVNARPVAAFRPLLLSLPGADGVTKVRPANAVTQRRWVDAATGAAVPQDLLRKAWPARVQGEQADLENTAAGLRQLGVARPELRASVRLVPLIHGVQNGPRVLRRCVDCHSPGGRMDTALDLGPLAQGPLAVLDAEGRSLPASTLAVDGGPGGVRARRGGQLDKLYLPGLGRQTLSTRLGFSFFLLTVLGVLVHGLWRWRTQSRRRHLEARPGRKVYLYPLYERLWHWTMALSTLGLVATGLEVHFNARFSLLGFAGAVRAHNALALLLLANGALSLFYHLSTDRIRDFIPRDKDLRGALGLQVRY